MPEESITEFVLRELVNCEPSADGEYIVVRAIDKDGVHLRLNIEARMIVKLAHRLMLCLDDRDKKHGVTAREIIKAEGFALQGRKPERDFVFVVNAGEPQPARFAFRLDYDLADKLVNLLLQRQIFPPYTGYSFQQPWRANASAIRAPYVARTFMTERESSHLHDPINQLLIVLCSIRIAGDAILSGKLVSEENSVMFLQSRQFDIFIVLPDYGPVQTALANKFPDRIQVELRSYLPPKIFAVESDRHEQPILQLLSGIFISFYETYRQWLWDNISKDVGNWPAPWTFSVVVRNAMAHGGYVDIRSKSHPLYVWHHIRVEYADSAKGRLLVGGDFTIADIVLLMIEMSDALATVGCPVRV